MSHRGTSWSTGQGNPFTLSFYLFLILKTTASLSTLLEPICIDSPLNGSDHLLLLPGRLALSIHRKVSQQSYYAICFVVYAAVSCFSGIIQATCNGSIHVGQSDMLRPTNRRWGGGGAQELGFFASMNVVCSVARISRWCYAEMQN